MLGWHQGHVVAACSTSGVPWKLPGRVGDSPILGAGLYADDQAGAAVATGLGEEIYRFTLTSRVVESMRRGATAQDACEQAVRFMVKRKPATAQSMIAVLAVRQDGRWGMAATRPGFAAYVRGGRGIKMLRS
jgi:isoaspartyl peptidase/L-asparaginase-like protein (Ntn-hydrolase superfamily)